MLYEPKLSKEGESVDEFICRLNSNYKILIDIDKKAKNKKTFLYRYINYPYADGYAIYQIVEILEKEVRIRVCTELGDDWVIPHIGKEGFVDKDFAFQSIINRDNMQQIIESKKKEKENNVTNTDW